MARYDVLLGTFIFTGEDTNDSRFREGILKIEGASHIDRHTITVPYATAMTCFDLHYLDSILSTTGLEVASIHKAEATPDEGFCGWEPELEGDDEVR
jgi:hypothetical protein